MKMVETIKANGKTYYAEIPGHFMDMVDHSLTKREHFAAMALQGILTNTSHSDATLVEKVEAALMFAKELVKQLEETEE